MKEVLVTALRLGFITGLFLFAGMAAVSSSDKVFPKPISSALPMYPEEARIARVAGSVKLWFRLNADGEVTQTGIVSGNPLLRDAAASVVRSWKFRLNALRANVRFETEFTYVLNVQPKEGEAELTVSMKDFRRVQIVSELYVKPIE